MLELDDDDSEKVSLEFSFSFFGEEYNHVFVNSDGNLTFGKGDASYRARDLQRLLGEAPRIGLLYQDLNPLSLYCSVEIKPSPGKITIPWFSVPMYASVWPIA